MQKNIREFEIKNIIKFFNGNCPDNLFSRDALRQLLLTKTIIENYSLV